MGIDRDKKIQRWLPRGVEHPPDDEIRRNKPMETERELSYEISELSLQKEKRSERSSR